ncbi:Threonine/homoserine/homoserine lactone efflux protein [Mesonia phycicola]|uniref:Threonine/homoserine/homoserine lactone efflux protein n=1 Tax=Mesonia phycicola TaxID=579105 RepID=A0A1M6D4N9_9FLAO|nr:LysE family transporter [Mesonia phycicola]SHI68081.1 Threonine/homoserine/homoserine lactone efflux protein [Mesonia phycicola]
MFQDILAAIPLGIFLAFLLGPVFFVLLETAAIKGFRAAVFFDIGVIVADIFFLSVSYLGTSKLLNSIKDDPALFIFGGCIMATYGVITFVKEKKAIPHPDGEDGIRKLKKSALFQLAVKGFLLNFVNIGVLGFWLGLIIVFGPQLEMNPNRLLVFFATVIITYFVIDLAKILLAKKLNHKLTPTRIYKLKKGISILIIIFGVVLISRGIFPSEMEQIENQVENIIPEKDTIN